MINQDKLGEYGPTIGITKILETGSSNNVHKLLQESRSTYEQTL